MDRRNLAYDLSFYEQEQERHIARKEKKESVIINAQTKFSFGRNLLKLVSLAAVLALGQMFPQVTKYKETVRD